MDDGNPFQTTWKNGIGRFGSDRQPDRPDFQQYHNKPTFLNVDRPLTVLFRGAVSELKLSIRRIQ